MSDPLLPTRRFPQSFPQGRVVRPGLAVALLSLLAGCTALGPDFEKPQPDAPDSWSQWHSGEQATDQLNVDNSSADLLWWREFNDPLLDELQSRMAANNPDLQTAALSFIRARLQQQIVGAQSVELNASGAAGRQRISENSPSMRMAEISAPGNADQLIERLAKPYTLYQAGFDASWEPDFWGRISRSVEAAGAEMRASAAELDEIRLALSAELARAYFQFLSIDQQIGLLEQQINLGEDQLELLQAQQAAGMITELPVERRLTQLRELNAGLPPLRSQSAALRNAMALLLGERPGALDSLLENADTQWPKNPAENPFKLGLPSELAQRRPDIQAAEARLHAATAQIGVARADLYPRITLNAGFGFETYNDSTIGEWSSRQWNIGPGFYLPLFNQGRLRKRVELTDVSQQQAAIQYRKTVLAAWQEIDDALTAYSAELERYTRLEEQQQSLSSQLELITANRVAGLTDSSAELEAKSALLGIERLLADGQAALNIQRVAVYKAVGGGI
ncbi:efflux transporter outer membrane subunit [Marinobacterium mangrovicola]|uniref:NodT family efflux transporter outer membrane factor (OMF) lipoprotein n=1 Tax=Marinobacterium mangrovicola TaxID=1476959 RepID=A0A4R1GFZ3_9GAMM|nr:efflux transporter outer membrane subunit [Marinobacterium mangrovicola]TCK05800.1 NodT family efflux transporter outer membrane factor (OMF) lipoprotein [Marinobacterium mangrovicola]